MNPLQTMRLARLAQRLERYVPQPEIYPDDAAGLVACRLAIDGLRAGNYGIGAVIMDQKHRPIVESSSRVFEPGFDSAGHAEMVAVDELERRFPDLAPANLTLVTSLEPCPMCYTRLKLAGLGRVRYLAPDPDGGMAHLAGRLPAIWRLLNPGQEFGLAAVSPELRQIARRLFLSNLRALRRRLLSRIQPPE
ncbi:MAG: nucleoside deaminase [Gammaproteobacteria bacterium]